MPLVDTRQPKTLPLCTPKTHFLGFRLRFAFRRLAKVSHMVVSICTDNHNVVDVGKYISSKLGSEDHRWHLWESLSYILETFRHSYEAVGAEGNLVLPVIYCLFIHSYEKVDETRTKVSKKTKAQLTIAMKFGIAFYILTVSCINLDKKGSAMRNRALNLGHGCNTPTPNHCAKPWFLSPWAIRYIT